MNGLWKGLGYYSRAARLLSGARKAVEVFGGRLPDNAQDMESKIPGIGRYSAGAICSIAYNERVPVVSAPLIGAELSTLPLRRSHLLHQLPKTPGQPRNDVPQLLLAFILTLMVSDWLTRVLVRPARWQRA